MKACIYMWTCCGEGYEGMLILVNLLWWRCLGTWRSTQTRKFQDGIISEPLLTAYHYFSGKLINIKIDKYARCSTVLVRLKRTYNSIGQGIWYIHTRNVENQLQINDKILCIEKSSFLPYIFGFSWQSSIEEAKKRHKERSSNEKVPKLHINSRAPFPSLLLFTSHYSIVYGILLSNFAVLFGNF